MKFKKLFLIIIIIIAIIGVLAVYTPGEHVEIGSNELGSVEKNTYNYYGSNITIAIITGMHPRETLAIEPEIASAKLFALSHGVNMINYDVDVTKDPTDYTNSRNNGESLVHDYIVPDIIENTTADAVIISHSHIEGYGEGFYVATPAMDDASVYLGESIRDSGINFNYFPSNSNGNYQSSSAALVSAPLANAGFPTLVYEIPENITSWDSTSRTYDLLQVVYDLIS